MKSFSLLLSLLLLTSCNLFNAPDATPAIQVKQRQSQLVQKMLENSLKFTQTLASFDLPPAAAELFTVPQRSLAAQYAQLDAEMLKYLRTIGNVQWEELADAGMFLWDTYLEEEGKIDG